MIIDLDYRPSDAPFVEGVWTSQSKGGGTFISQAESHWEMVVTQQQNRTTFTIRGPEIEASPAPVPEDAEFLGIIFKLGAFMPALPTIERLNSGINLPDASSQSFWLLGSSWEFPSFENADTFVNRLIREGLLTFDPIIETALQNKPVALTPRSVERRFVHATGLTQGSIRQIQRARYALSLLQHGVSILDTVDQAGYSDQPHLTRALKRFLGQTPAQVLRQDE